MPEYKVVLTKDDEGNWLASVPAIPGCHSWGATRSEAIANAREAVEACLESLAATGDPAPSSDLPVEVETITVTPAA